MAKRMDGKIIGFLLDAYENFGGTWINDFPSLSQKHNMTSEDVVWCVRNRYLNHRQKFYAVSDRSISLLEDMGVNTQDN
jgi:hypothetical protein